MTKAIRIENADTSDFKVVVEVYERSGDGTPDKLVHSHTADYPTAMVNDYLTSTRYIVVKEAP